MKRSLVLLLGGLALLAAFPHAVHACAVCFDPRGETRMAFVTTALFMTFLPLGFVAGMGLFLKRRLRNMQAEDDGVDEGSPQDSSGLSR